MFWVFFYFNKDDIISYLCHLYQLQRVTRLQIWQENLPVQSRCRFWAMAVRTLRDRSSQCKETQRAVFADKEMEIPFQARLCLDNEPDLPSIKHHYWKGVWKQRERTQISAIRQSCCKLDVWFWAARGSGVSHKAGRGQTSEFWRLFQL